MSRFNFFAVKIQNILDTFNFNEIEIFVHLIYKFALFIFLFYIKHFLKLIYSKLLHSIYLFFYI